MGLYLGSSEKLNISIANTVCSLIVPSATPMLNGVTLLSYDGYILKDSNGIYLIAREDN